MRVSFSAAIATCLATCTVAILHPLPIRRASQEAVGCSYNETAPVNASYGETFSLKQVENKNYHRPSASSELLRAYGKYSSILPPDMEKALEANSMLNRTFMSLAKRDIGKVGAYPPDGFDTQFVVPVRLGTPSQLTYLILDTGSSDLWTFSTDTDKSQARGHTLYRPGRSRTSRKLKGSTWDIEYGDGTNAKGVVYRDKVQVGGTSFSAQAIESAVQVSDALAEDTFSHGILGLGMSIQNTVRPKSQKTYFDNIKGRLNLPIFTANLQKGKPGNYNFGFIDESEFNGVIKWAPMDQTSPYWKLDISGYKIGNSRYRRKTMSVIADTGTSLLLLPKSIVRSYYSRVKGARLNPDLGVMTFPCSSDLPDFAFGLGEYRGIVPGNYINYGQYDASNCYGGIQSSEGIGFSIFGDVLLKAQFVVFDKGQMHIGFANKDTVKS